MFRKLINSPKLRILKGQLAQKIFGTFGLKISSLGLSLVTSIFLSRMLGAAGYGTYAYALVWLGILNIPATLGLRELMVREVATCQSKQQFTTLRGLLFWSNRMVLGSSIAIAVAAAVVAWLIQPDHTSLGFIVFLIALLNLPFMALTALRQATIQGLHRVVIGQVPELIIQPMVFVAVLGITYGFTQQPISSVWVIITRLVTVFLSFLIGSFILARILPKKLSEFEPDYQRTGQWLRSVLPFILISSTVLINTRADAVMLGAMKGAESVGIYTVLARGAEFTTMALLVVNQSIRPKLAQLYSQGRLDLLQALVTKSAQATTLAAVPITLFLIVFGQWYLWLFGAEFVQGYTALSLLSIGKLLSAMVGSVGLLLSMTGHERDTSICVAFSAFSNIVLNTLLIPKWGINGAACATLSSSILWNISLCFLVYKRLNIKPSFLGKFVDSRS